MHLPHLVPRRRGEQGESANRRLRVHHSPSGPSRLSSRLYEQSSSSISEILLCSHLPLHQGQERPGYPVRQIRSAMTTPVLRAPRYVLWYGSRPQPAPATGPPCRCTVPCHSCTTTRSDSARYTMLLLTFHLFRLPLTSSTQIKAGQALCKKVCELISQLQQLSRAQATCSELPHRFLLWSQQRSSVISSTRHLTLKIRNCFPSCIFRGQC